MSKIRLLIPFPKQNRREVEQQTVSIIGQGEAAKVRFDLEMELDSI
jgi:hypothetical protein